ncbi:MAG: DEAD/DEAH box helicase [Bdellovibrionota bacterium]|nr:DEAD/DEAH box helicase [Bdellovibrionota bacterium]
MTFQQFELNSGLIKALDAMGFDSPTDIQEKAIPVLLEASSDFVGQAQTGTGKTAAFLLPLLEKIEPRNPRVQALILTPTRELAMQIEREISKLAKFIDVGATTIYGGTPYEKQERALRKDKPQIIVGTPGRVLDLIKKRTLKMSESQFFVIDEADEMLNMGFLDDVKEIMQSLPEEVNTWMFSATMPKEISSLVKGFFKDPQFIKTKNKTLTNTSIEQYFCLMEKKDFIKGLRRVVASDEEGHGIVFCETRGECKTVADKLMDLGVNALPLHGELSQSQREYAMERFKAKKVQLLICTDIAARGIDVQDLKFVINFSLPRQHESYIHRIGRTGRAGQKGMAITFVTPREKNKIRMLERTTGQTLSPFELPDIETLKGLKVKTDLEKMTSLKNAILERGEAFKTDMSFDLFEEYFSDLSKEDLLKLFFSTQFNKEFRMLEQALTISKPKPHREGRLRREGRQRRGASSERSERSEGSRGRNSRRSSRDSDRPQRRRRRRN